MIIISLILFLLSLATNHVLMSRAQRTLNAEQKVAVMDGASKHTPWFYVVLAVIVGIWTFALYWTKGSRLMIPAIMVIVFGLTIVHSLIHLRQLKRLELPKKYTDSVAIASVIPSVAMAVVFGVIFHVFWFRITP